MASSAVMTVRIDADLLAALKEKARDEGRSVSAEVVRLVQQHVAARPRAKSRRTGFGMFSEFECVGLEEIRAVRHEVTRRATRRSTRRKSHR